MERYRVGAAMPLLGSDLLGEGQVGVSLAVFRLSSHLAWVRRVRVGRSAGGSERLQCRSASFAAGDTVLTSTPRVAVSRRARLASATGPSGNTPPQKPAR